MVVFAPQNVIHDPPFTKLDVLSCRNLLIYLSPELQKKIIPLFHYSLNPGGILLLGSAETIGSFSSLFAPLDAKTRMYRRTEQSSAVVPVEFPSSPLSAAGGARSEAEGDGRPVSAPPNLQALADRAVAQLFAPVAVLCNDKGELLYSSRRAGRYLEPPAGKTNFSVFSMAREGLRFELSRAFAAALRDDGAITVTGIRVATDAGTQTVDLRVLKLAEPKELRGTVMVVFTDVVTGPQPAKRPKSRADHNAQLSDELQRSRDEVQTAREEMQTSQEELKSTNEELQSTNEELTTSKEELQSLNEELQTVNQELQVKVDELSRSNNDMKNLLNSTDIATLFLDADLQVRRFTTPTSKIIKLIPSDIGRPITDLSTDLHYPDLADDARQVLATLVFTEKQVTTEDCRWFRVRIMPYRTLENVIDGVVITFTDVKILRGVEDSLRGQSNTLRRMLDALAEGSREAFVGLDSKLNVVAFSREARELLAPPANATGRMVLDALPGLRQTELAETLRTALEDRVPISVQIDLGGSGGGPKGAGGAAKRRYDVRAVPQQDATGLTLFFVRAEA